MKQGNTLRRKCLSAFISSAIVLGCLLGFVPGMSVDVKADETTYKIIANQIGVIEEAVTLPYETTINAFRSEYYRENMFICTEPTIGGYSTSADVVTLGSQIGTLGQSDCDYNITINCSGMGVVEFSILWDGDQHPSDITFNVVPNTDLEGTGSDYSWRYTYATKTLDVLSGNPSSVLGAQDLAFVEINTVNISDEVTGLGDRAFDYGYGLQSININPSSSITSIGTWAFSNCTSLTNITIPFGVTSISDTAFNNCPNIADVYCYADPSVLNWTTSNTYENFKQGKGTVCHVMAEDLEAWQAKPNLNLTFVGDLQAPQAEATASDYSGTYDGAAHSITVNVTKPAAGYTVTYGTVDGTYDLASAPEYTEAGTYTVYYKVSATHYSDLTGSATVTINPKPLTITAVAANKNVGEDDPTFTYTSDGLVGNDTITGSLSREPGETAGTYAITLGTLDAGDNYAISFTGADFTIVAAQNTTESSQSSESTQSTTDSSQPSETTQSTQGTTEPTTSTQGSAQSDSTTTAESTAATTATTTPTTVPAAASQSVTYINTSGAGGSWTIGSTDALGFRFSRSEDDASTFGHFTGIKVDGVDVAACDYSARSGSVIIELNPGYLQTMTAGEHTLTVMFDDADPVTVTFTIVAAAAPTPTTAPAPATPSTGESASGYPMFGTVMLIASAAAFCMRYRTRKDKIKIRKTEL